jgi:hypothetical protein
MAIFVKKQRVLADGMENLQPGADFVETTLKDSAKDGEVHPHFLAARDIPA